MRAKTAPPTFGAGQALPKIAHWSLLNLALRYPDITCRDLTLSPLTVGPIAVPLALLGVPMHKIVLLGILLFIIFVEII
jgi:hypothetical protein